MTSLSLARSLAPKFIKNRILLLKSYLNREPVAKGFPIELSVELTNHCNADCIMCPRAKMQRKKGFMDFDLFKKIADQAKEYTELISLHLAGEPLLHPELMRMINYCGKIGLKTMLSTNSILLDAAKARELLDSPLSLLTLSLDSVTKETYEKIKGRPDFDVVYGNIDRFLHLKDKSRKRPYTIVQLVYLKENAGEAREFISKWKAVKADAVRIKPYFNYPGLDGYLGKNPKRSTTYLNPCILLWRQLTIYWDGTAVSCCQDFLSQMVVGDANRESIKDIWNSGSMLNMRKLHARGGWGELALCKDCTMPQVKLPLLLATVLLDALTIKKLLPKIEQSVILNDIRRFSYFS